MKNSNVETEKWQRIITERALCRSNDYSLFVTYNNNHQARCKVKHRERLCPKHNIADKFKLKLLVVYLFIILYLPRC